MFRASSSLAVGDRARALCLLSFFSFFFFNHHKRGRVEAQMRSGVRIFESSGTSSPWTISLTSERHLLGCTSWPPGSSPAIYGRKSASLSRWPGPYTQRRSFLNLFSCLFWNQGGHFHGHFSSHLGFVSFSFFKSSYYLENPGAMLGPSH